MAFENQNQLKIQHDEGYYNIGPTNTPKQEDFITSGVVINILH